MQSAAEFPVTREGAQRLDRGRKVLGLRAVASVFLGLVMPCSPGDCSHSGRGFQPVGVFILHHFLHIEKCVG